MLSDDDTDGDVDSELNSSIAAASRALTANGSLLIATADPLVRCDGGEFDNVHEEALDSSSDRLSCSKHSRWR